ncbi:MAG TPA: hypothetical protein DCW31_07915, partial [Lactobacillus sp.]|nr:hypothetical protein [Lactobacillus sp.]
MPKQGQHAGSSRQKKLRQLHQRISDKGQHNISNGELTNFLLVRWHLTNHHQTNVEKQTTQHFLSTWLDEAQSN